MDDTRRIAMVETKTVDADVSGTLAIVPRLRFQYTNHLDSAHLECDETGLVISYEEYHPYGTPAYRSASAGVEVSEKRYRYTGKERDEETGFQYHSARYYAPWLGRWTSADPLGIAADGPCLFAYVAGNPQRFVDPNGTDGAAVFVGRVSLPGGGTAPAPPAIVNGQTIVLPGTIITATGRPASPTAVKEAQDPQAAKDAHDAAEASRLFWLAFVKPQLEAGHVTFTIPTTPEARLRESWALMSPQERASFSKETWERSGVNVGIPIPENYDPIDATISRWRTNALQMEGTNQGFDIASAGIAAGGAVRRAAFRIEGELTVRGFFSRSYEVGSAGGFQWGARTVEYGRNTLVLKQLAGAGPTAGVLEVSPLAKSVAAFRTYSPGGSREAIEFVFDPNTERFAVGMPKYRTPMYSPHEQLAAAIGADRNAVVGGLFRRGPLGEILTNERSGHFWQNWTPEIRSRMKHWLQTRTGQTVIHLEE
ncbi:MAG: RHS repeat-associated core domain-containing protein [Polyangiaceae bacterium]